MKMENQSFFSSNVKFLRTRKNISQEQLSTELGITRSQLSAYEKGQTKNPTLEMMLLLSACFKISLDILIKIDLTILPELKIKEYESRSDSDIAGKELRVIVTTVNVNNRLNIEHVPIKAKAGYLRGYSQEEYISKLPVYTLPNLPRDRKFRSFPCEGDSMYPFPEGAIIVGEYVDNWFTLKHDVPCIVVTKDGIVFKLVTSKLQDERNVILKSLNDVYKPYAVGADSISEIWKYKCYIADTVPNPATSLEDLDRCVREIQLGVRTLLKTKN